MLACDKSATLASVNYMSGCVVFVVCACDIMSAGQLFEAIGPRRVAAAHNQNAPLLCVMD